MFEDWRMGQVTPLSRVHGNGDAGEYGLTKSAVRLVIKFYWPGWMDVIVRSAEAYC